MNKEIAEICRVPDRNLRVGTYGEYLVKKILEMSGAEVVKSQNNTVDWLVLGETKKPWYAVEVKTHQGTETEFDGSPIKFRCLHLEDRIIDNLKMYQDKYKIYVEIIWVQPLTGQVFNSKLRDLLINKNVNGVDFPRVSPFTDAKKTCFAEDQFHYIATLPYHVHSMLKYLMRNEE